MKRNNAPLATDNVSYSRIKKAWMVANELSYPWSYTSFLAFCLVHAYAHLNPLYLHVPLFQASFVLRIGSGSSWSGTECASTTKLASGRRGTAEAGP